MPGRSSRRIRRSTLKRSLDSAVKFARVLGTNFVAASLGSAGIDIGANADVDSLVSLGPVRLGTNTRVHGYVSGTSNVTGTGLTMGIPTY